MDLFYKICFVLILAYISQAIGATWELERSPRYYERNPFLISSSPMEKHRHVHFNGNDHHHHHDQNADNQNRNDFYSNQKERYNDYDDNNFPGNNQNNDFRDQNFNNRFPDEPKSISRREAGQAGDEHHPDYPYDDIRKILDNKPLLRQYAEIPQTVPDLVNRLADDDDYESLCKMQTVKIYFPKKLTNINNVERLIVNDENEYKQAIEQTRCISGQPCNLPFDTFGYVSICHQNYNNKRLMVYEKNGTDTKIAFDLFKVPTSCECKIKKI